ncbi:MAG: GNAT family N-acetyltransferase [Pirellulales bacterium]|nr:GNAT family N-acetyltransferase [Pirellulales bacterium]
MIRIRTMSEADLPLGMRLKAQAGWNQTEADWRRVLQLEPEGCFVAEYHGEPVGTTAAVTFGRVAWIMMVLVDEAVRGRGIGTRLMQHAIDYLAARAVPTIRLDATPLGRPVYERLGFQAEYQLARFQHNGLKRQADPDRLPATAEQLDAICALDQRATGADRSRLIRRLYHEQPSAFAVASRGESVAGYRAFRTGAHATQIGPAVAASAEIGQALLDGTIAQLGPVPMFVDIPLENRPAVEWANEGGFTLQRHLTRMWKGERVEDRPAELWASFGPEKG